MDVDQRPWIDRPQGAAMSLRTGRPEARGWAAQPQARQRVCSHYEIRPAGPPWLVAACWGLPARRCLLLQDIGVTRQAFQLGIT
jgi:hypothetical protein